jgi:predicted Zn-dependent protease
VHKRRGEQDRAIERYQRALELNPSTANVMASLASPMMYTGHPDKAVELMR